MPLSDVQLSAVLEAQRLLANVGFKLTTPTNLDDLNFLETFPIASACAAVQGSFYRPPPALPSTAEEIRRGLDCINRQIYVNSLVEHSAGSMVEYQETGTSKGVAVAHRFSVDPLNFSYLTENFQYSLGDSHGGESYVYCGSLLIGREGNPASCTHRKLSYSHSIWTRWGRPRKRSFPKLSDSTVRLLKKDVAPNSQTTIPTPSQIRSPTLMNPNPRLAPPKSSRIVDAKKAPRSWCKGKLEVRLDEYGRFFVQCEHHKKTDKAHLILRTLDEFDITYLRALLENDTRIIDEREELARIDKTLTGIAPPENWHAGYFSDQKSLLLDLDWKLADATPRKLMIDSGFMSSFRRALGWKKPFDPPLAALHPSLGNLDHHLELPEDEQYVRCAETHTIEDGKHSSWSSLSSCDRRKLSLDTAFKRLKGKWQEFEMETWELDRMKSLIGTRAFTTSQSAQAHLILFTRIFEIAQGDTGTPCRFRHIHGEGFELWITDSHKGQALAEYLNIHLSEAEWGVKFRGRWIGRAHLRARCMWEVRVCPPLSSGELVLRRARIFFKWGTSVDALAGVERGTGRGNGIAQGRGSHARKNEVGGTRSRWSDNVEKRAGGGEEESRRAARCGWRGIESRWTR
ncbi:hypothetical protein DFH09DRAFT_1108430 [Mycena vulgaris]|nr:hypothetical protein DFH09DRAFT_1108430 [Mycena vulgaris]